MKVGKQSVAVINDCKCKFQCSNKVMIVELSINLSLLLIDAWFLPFRSMKREEKKKKKDRGTTGSPSFSCEIILRNTSHVEI